MNNISFWRVLIYWNMFFFGFAIFIALFLSTIFSFALYFDSLEHVYISIVQQFDFWLVFGLTVSPFFAIKPALKYIESNIKIAVNQSCDVNQIKNLDEMNLSDIRNIWRTWILRTILIIAVLFFINYIFNIYSEHIFLIVFFIFATVGTFNMWQILDKKLLK